MITSKMFEKVCKNVDLPECSIFKRSKTTYNSISETFFNYKIMSPYTLGILFIAILVTLRMISHANALYASIGSSEMKLIYFLYILNNILLLITICLREVIPEVIFIVLTSIQISINSTMHFSIFLSGITIDKIYGILKMPSSAFMLAILVLYFVIISIFIAVSVIIQNIQVYSILFVFNSSFLLMYVVYQVRKLKKISADIWPYGILFIMVAIKTIELSLLLFLGRQVFILSSKSLDNLFFIIMDNLFFMNMLHKYWSSVCDFEIECLTIEA